VVAAALALFALHGSTHETLMNSESLA
jgi:hypothetical protein